MSNVYFSLLWIGFKRSWERDLRLQPIDGYLTFKRALERANKVAKELD